MYIHEPNINHQSQTYSRYTKNKGNGTHTKHLKKKNHKEETKRRKSSEELQKQPENS